MKYPAHVYAKALAEAIVSGAPADALRVNFFALLRRSGDDVHAAKIVSEAERIMRATDGTKRIIVSFARKQPRSARELVKHLAGPHDVVEEEIDPSLVAGVKVRINDERAFDGSLKAKLDAMFKV